MDAFTFIMRTTVYMAFQSTSAYNNICATFVGSEVGLGATNTVIGSCDSSRVARISDGLVRKSYVDRDAFSSSIFECTASFYSRLSLLMGLKSINWDKGRKSSELEQHR